MEFTSGKRPRAKRVVVYGPEGIGKSTFASKFPDPRFMDVEGSTDELDVLRTPKATSWTMLMDQAKFFYQNPTACSTLVVDTGDWAERLCATHVCAKGGVNGIADFGYGNGYVYLEEEFGRFLNILFDIVERGTNVVILCHAQMRKFEQPDEIGAYDRWELKLEKKVAALVKEWADMILFANYKTYVVNVDGQGTQKGKNKAQGGQRVMYTTHHPCWDAKNRQGLADELPFEFQWISPFIPAQSSVAPIPPEPPKKQTPPPQKEQPAPAPDQQKASNAEADVQEIDPGMMPAFPSDAPLPDSIPKALRDLMDAKGVAEHEIKSAVASRGYYPVDTPIENYDPKFIDGVLIAAWPQVYDMISKARAVQKQAS